MDDTRGKQSSSGLEYKLHPLVLINISDHHTRTRANTPNVSSADTVKVLGCLLGIQSGRTIDISNSFEIKFGRGADGAVDIDNVFLLHKQEQYKQVFPKQDVVGWYLTGEDADQSDMLIHRRVMELNESPVLLVLNPRVDHTRKDLPVTLYETEFHVTDGLPSFIFVKSSYVVETSDAERIAVDQVAKIMPSGKATGSEQLTAHLVGVHSAIKMLNERVKMLQKLVAQIGTGEVPYHHALLRKVSSLVHSLPALDVASFQHEYLKDYNDTLLTIYLSSITKGVTNLNEVVDKVMVAYDRFSSRRRGGLT